MHPWDLNILITWIWTLSIEFFRVRVMRDYAACLYLAWCTVHVPVCEYWNILLGYVYISLLITCMVLWTLICFVVVLKFYFNCFCLTAKDVYLNFECLLSGDNLSDATSHNFWGLKQWSPLLFLFAFDVIQCFSLIKNDTMFHMILPRLYFLSSRRVWKWSRVWP